MKALTWLQLLKEEALKAKEKYGSDVICLFCVSNLYMVVEDDADACSKVLGVPMSVSGTDSIKSVAFPECALDTYLPKLVKAGYRICILDNPLK